MKEKKIAIVTGANSGMGLATVEALSDRGFTVIMLCRNMKGRNVLDTGRNGDEGIFA